MKSKKHSCKTTDILLVKCVCALCGRDFKSEHKKKYCSKTCYRRAWNGKGAYKPILIKKCIVCGTPFATLKESSIVCSRSCRMAHDRIVRNRRYKELKKTGDFDHSVTLIAVFEKFDGKCQICGKEMTFDVDWLCEDYPSIDHIKPLSKGGSHTWNNVQLLCRRCNYYKGNSL